NDIIRVQLGDSAEVEVDSYTTQNEKFKGIVTAIANTAKDALTAEAVTEFERPLPGRVEDPQRRRARAGKRCRQPQQSQHRRRGQITLQRASRYWLGRPGPVGAGRLRFS
nr:hypothetical protein [Tanacetum cinerariifolium]